jgi:chorismate synthase
MPDYVTREEFEARVGVLEREGEGEKMVTRHILEQTRRNSDDLAAIKTRLDRVEKKVDGLDEKVDGLERKADSLGAAINGLARNLPAVVGEAVRDAMREKKS